MYNIILGLAILVICTIDPDTNLLLQTNKDLNKVYVTDVTFSISAKRSTQFSTVKCLIT